MAKYFIDNNAKENGDHEVHRSDCLVMPIPSESSFLGDFTYVMDFLKEAKKYHKQVSACSYCISPWNVERKESVVKDL